MVITLNDPNIIGISTDYILNFEFHVNNVPYFTEWNTDVLEVPWTDRSHFQYDVPEIQDEEGDEVHVHVCLPDQLHDQEYICQEIEGQIVYDFAEYDFAEANTVQLFIYLEDGTTGKKSERYVLSLVFVRISIAPYFSEWNE